MRSNSENLTYSDLKKKVEDLKVFIDLVQLDFFNQKEVVQIFYNKNKSKLKKNAAQQNTLPENDLKSIFLEFDIVLNRASENIKELAKRVTQNKTIIQHLDAQRLDLMQETQKLFLTFVVAVLNGYAKSFEDFQGSKLGQYSSKNIEKIISNIANLEMEGKPKFPVLSIYCEYYLKDASTQLYKKSEETQRKIANFFDPIVVPNLSPNLFSSYPSFQHHKSVKNQPNTDEENLISGISSNGQINDHPLVNKSLLKEYFYDDILQEINGFFRATNEGQNLLLYVDVIDEIQEVDKLIKFAKDKLGLNKMNIEANYNKYKRKLKQNKPDNFVDKEDQLKSITQKLDAQIEQASEKIKTFNKTVLEEQKTYFNYIKKIKNNCVEFTKNHERLFLKFLDVTIRNEKPTTFQEFKNSTDIQPIFKDLKRIKADIHNLSFNADYFSLLVSAYNKELNELKETLYSKSNELESELLTFVNLFGNMQLSNLFPSDWKPQERSVQLQKEKPSYQNIIPVEGSGSANLQNNIENNALEISNNFSTINLGLEKEPVHNNNDDVCILLDQEPPGFLSKKRNTKNFSGHNLERIFDNQSNVPQVSEEEQEPLDGEFEFENKLSSLKPNERIENKSVVIIEEDDGCILLDQPPSGFLSTKSNVNDLSILHPTKETFKNLPIAPQASVEERVPGECNTMHNALFDPFHILMQSLPKPERIIVGKMQQLLKDPKNNCFIDENSDKKSFIARNYAAAIGKVLCASIKRNCLNDKSLKIILIGILDAGYSINSFWEAFSKNIISSEEQEIYLSAVKICTEHLNSFVVKNKLEITEILEKAKCLVSKSLPLKEESLANPLIVNQYQLSKNSVFSESRRKTSDKSPIVINSDDEINNDDSVKRLKLS